MAVNLSIKNVPDELAERLRARATRHHRSLQGELLDILETTLGADKRLTANEIHWRVREQGLATGADSVVFVRADRDAR